MRAKKDYGQMPVYFVENRGQVDSRVAYFVQGRDTSIYFEKKGVTFAVTEKKAEKKIEKAGFRKASLPLDRDRGDAGKRWAVKLDFVGANPNVRITADEKTPAVVSYFKGPKETWKTGLPTYSSITYQELWPGIDLVYSGTANRLKYSFVVKPGADPAHVRLAYRGAKGVRINDLGQLEVETPAGGFKDDTPYAYQDIGGRRSPVPAVYALDEAAGDGAREYGFALGAYDHSEPLVLDPAVLVYAGFIGGSGIDLGNGIAVDSSGSAYVTGNVGSTEATFPVTAGPDLTYNGGTTDAFVAKVNAAGTALLYAGYIGGSGNDAGFGIAVDSSGNAYVTGETSSTQGTFPVTVGPDLTQNGGFDAFVAKVNAAGTALIYAGYIGGSGGDYGYGIAVDSSGNAYVTGQTDSTQATFPVTVGPDLTQNGGTDAFVAKVNAAGTALLYAGFIGGSGSDAGLGVAVDSSGNAYVTGETDSTQATFPVAIGPDVTQNGGTDAFVAKVNAAGTALLYSGYIGGTNGDYGLGIAVDSSGNAYVTGYTSSTEATFPVTVGPDLTINGGTDAFVAKVNAAGTALVYAGYIGGSGDDYGSGIAVDSSGNAYVTGYTDSTQATFPVTGGPDLTQNGNTDAFVAKVNAAGTALLYAGYIGGINGDYGLGIAVDSSGNAYVTGYTASTQATFPVTVGPDLTQNGSYDAFVAKISNVVRGDLDGNGKADILWRNISTGANTIWLMNGTNVSSLAALPTIPDQGWQIGGVGDLSGDGNNDIVWRNDFTGQNTIWVMNGAALSSQLPLPPVADLNWKIRAVADFDADGKPDLLWRNISTGQNTVWFMNGPSVTGVATVPGVSDVNWEIDGAADFNGDGRSDILWRNLATGQNTIWLMNGTVVASLAAVPPVTDLNWRIGGVGDYTNDGQPDILWRNLANGQNTVWVMNGPQVTSAIGVPPVSDLNWRIAGPR